MQSRTETYAGTSSTLPLRLYVGRRLGPRWTLGVGRPKPRRGLRGSGLPRRGNPACAAFARETPTALVAKRSAGVIPCGPAPRRPAFTKHDARTRRSPSAHRHHFSTSARVGFGVDLFGSNDPIQNCAEEISTKPFSLAILKIPKLPRHDEHRALALRSTCCRPFPHLNFVAFQINSSLISKCMHTHPPHVPAS
jgi:hypothetical protein